jgi:hypothetical protein
MDPKKIKKLIDQVKATDEANERAHNDVANKAHALEATFQRARATFSACFASYAKQCADGGVSAHIDEERRSYTVVGFRSLLNGTTLRCENLISLVVSASKGRHAIRAMYCQSPPVVSLCWSTPDHQELDNIHSWAAQSVDEQTVGEQVDMVFESVMRALAK